MRENNQDLRKIRPVLGSFNDLSTALSLSHLGYVSDNLLLAKYNSQKSKGRLTCGVSAAPAE